MIPFQPTNLLSYMGWRRTSAPPSLSTRDYLSWEDALWDIIDSYELSTEQCVLVPEFWCMDVVKNIKAHGMRVEFYPMDQYFQTTSAELAQSITQHDPAIVVVFHPVGITNSLLTHDRAWMCGLKTDTILIEDSVHRTVDPSQVMIDRQNTFVIDSWRKVVPLQGARLYALLETYQRLHDDITVSAYSWRVILDWVRFQVLLMWLRWIPECAQHAERSMMDAYDLIGTSRYPGGTPRIFSFLFDHLDHIRIRQTKARQVKKYLQFFSQRSSSDWFLFPLTTSDHGELRQFPIGLYKSRAREVIDRLRVRGLYVRSELVGCPWQARHEVIYLPLGPYLSMQDIDEVCAIFTSIR